MPLRMALLFTWNDVVLACWNDINTTPCTWSQPVLYWSLHVLAEQNQANDASFWYPFQWLNHTRENPRLDWPDYLYACCWKFHCCWLVKLLQLPARWFSKLFSVEIPGCRQVVKLYRLKGHYVSHLATNCSTNGKGVLQVTYFPFHVSFCSAF